ncbi:MAG: hypothetical protein J7L15_03460, partial [Clostridiales bacterium]|nr:hypothetical protein [Clostridiales bacterium]
ANINHNRQGYVIGTILDAWVNNNEEIEIVFSFFKSLYPKEWEITEQAIDDGEMNVSFELSVENDDIIDMGDGVRKIAHCLFDGVGILFPGVAPAYPEASILESASQIVNSIFENKKTLICASAKEAVYKLEKALIENKKIGDNNMDNKANEVLLAKQKEFIAEKFGNEAVKDWSEDDYFDQTKIDALQENLDAENQAKVDKETLKAKEKADLEAKELADKKALEEATKYKSTTTSVYEVVDDTEKGTTEVVETITTVSTVDGVESINEKTVRTTLYTFAKVEAMVESAKVEVKADSEKLIAEVEAKNKEALEAKDVELKAKDEEIATIKENAVKIVKIRAEFGEYVKELSDEQLFDETLMEIAKLKKELAEEKAKGKKIKTASIKKDDLSATIDDSVNDSEEFQVAKKQVAKQRVAKQIIAKLTK